MNPHAHQSLVLQTLTLALPVRDILVGCPAGALHEVVVDEKDKKERIAKKVFQLQDSKEPISSVYQHQASQGHRMVLMATTKRLYVFSGKGVLEPMFARYTSPGNSTFHFGKVHFPMLQCIMQTLRCLSGQNVCGIRDCMMSIKYVVADAALSHVDLLHPAFAVQ